MSGPLHSPACLSEIAFRQEEGSCALRPQLSLYKSDLDLVLVVTLHIIGISGLQLGECLEDTPCEPSSSLEVL